MKILTSEQVYQADQATINNRSISSTELMEKAAGACVSWLLHLDLSAFDNICILCGPGNNGGDGLVIARELLRSGYPVQTYLVNFSAHRSPDFKINWERLKAIGQAPRELSGRDELPQLSSKDLVIDAIFGIGLSRAPEGFVKEVIQWINHSGATIVSIDFPSGLFAESSVNDPDSVIHADYTLTFQNPKLAFLLAENQSYTGSWEVLDIGLDKSFIEAMDSPMDTVDLPLLKSFYRPRGLFSHKGTFGHSLLIGGSFGKTGAVMLASGGAIRAGSGLVTAYLPKCGYQAIQSKYPEVMAEVDDENYVQYFNFSTQPDAIGIGPGLGMHLKTKKGFVDFLRRNRRPLVIDADALNIIAEYDELSELIPEGAILTPHPKEFQRLAGSWRTDYEKLDLQKNFALDHNCVVVLKGAFTSIACMGRLFFNTTGNPALATAGSGDVLTGILTALLAQGYEPLQAALLGVYLHGRTADLAVGSSESPESFSASDIAGYLGRAFKEIA